MGQPNPLRAPLRGLNTLDPFIDFDSGYARELTNYSILNGSLSMRPSVRLVNGRTDFTVTKINWYSASADSGIERVGGDIVTLSTGVTTGNIGGNCQDNAIPFKHLSLSMITGCREPRNQAAPFTAWTFTTLGIAATAISSACSHKGRLYVSDGSTIEYSDIGQITGAMKGTFVIAPFMEGQFIDRMFSVTAQPGNNASNLFVVFGSLGKVLVYDGSYPGSPDWNIIGNYNMPFAGSNTCFVETDGDIFVATEPYAYWFRDLFSSGAQTAYDNSPTKPIQNLWGSFVWRNFVGVEPACAFYYADQDCIICKCASANFLTLASYQPTGTFLVYFKQYRAWALWVMPDVSWPFIGIDGIDAGNSILRFTTDRTEDTYSIASSSIARSRIIESTWKSPYYYPQAGVNRMLAGVKPYFRNFISPSPSPDVRSLDILRAIYDFSDYNVPFGFYPQSSFTPTDPGIFTNGTISVPSNASSIYTEFCGLGGNGGGFSIQLTQIGIASAFNEQGIYQASINFDEGAAYPA